MSRQVRYCRVIFAFSLAMLSTSFASSVLQAQPPDDQWSEPLRVGESGAFPTMVVDSAGRLHLMWTANVTGQEIAGWGDTLFYARLDGRGWSEPVDVLVAPAGSAADFPEIVLGTDGKLHAFWRMGNRILHNWASISNAESARSWTTVGDAFVLDLSATQLFPYAVAVDQEGFFHAVYVDILGGEWCVLYVRSEDNGNTWSLPVRVSTAPQGTSVSLPRLEIGSQGDIHAVWTQFELPEGWPPTGVFYARSTDGGQTWSEAVQLGGAQQGWANLIAIDDAVHVVWNGSSSAAGRYHRWSADGGETWSVVNLISNLGGMTQGVPDMAVDSAGTLHLVFFADSIYHAAWDGQAWTELEVISPGKSGGTSARHPTIVVGEGNKLHIGWSSAPPVGSERLPGIWYTAQRTLAPHVPSEPLPPPMPALTHALTTTPVTPATLAYKPEVLTLTTSEEHPGDADPGFPILVGLLPAALLIGIVVLVKATWLRRS